MKNNKRKSNQEEQNQVQENERKKSKREMTSKIRDEVTADYKGVTYEPDAMERRKMQTVTLSAVFETYFRILKNTMYSIGESTEADLDPGVNLPESPYGFTFSPLPPAYSGMKPMNVSTYSCSDDTLGCSCGDCPSASACSSTAAPPTQKRRFCSIKIGSLEAKCVDFVLAILYIVLVSLFHGGGLLHRVKGKKKSSPSSEARGERNSVSLQKPDTIHGQMLQNTPQRNWAQLSTVEGLKDTWSIFTGSMGSG